MAKKSMIERETKRESLNIQYKYKKNLLRKELRDIKYLESFQDLLCLYKKMESIPKNSEHHVSVTVVGCQGVVEDFTEASDYQGIL